MEAGLPLLQEALVLPLTRGEPLPLPVPAPPRNLALPVPEGE